MRVGRVVMEKGKKYWLGEIKNFLEWSVGSVSEFFGFYSGEGVVDSRVGIFRDVVY